MARTTATARKTTGGKAPRKAGPQSVPPPAGPPPVAIATPGGQAVVPHEPKHQVSCLTTFWSYSGDPLFIMGVIRIFVTSASTVVTYGHVICALA
jgi:hypothetical protein